MRYMIIGDVHYTQDPPRRRKDSYGHEILLKLCWLADVATRLKLTGVIFTGDLFHRKRATLAEVHDLMEVLKTFTCPLHACVGNHDVVGHSSLDLSSTGVGVLFKSGVLNRIDRVWDQSEDDGTAVLSAVDYCPDYESKDPYAVVDMDGDRPWIHVTHGTVLESAPHWEGAFTLVKDIVVPDNVLMVNGHIHHPFERGNFWNVGSLCRASIEDQEAHANPTVLIAQWDGAWKVKRLAVPVEEDVWTDEVERVQATNNDTIAQFVKNLSTEEVSIEQGRDSVIDELIKKGGHGDAVRDTVYELIASQET